MVAKRKKQKELNILALIPARGGSKGLPGKNIKEFNGKPLIAYVIQEANKSRYINKIILSTDDEKIAKVCSKYKIEIPFMRPKYLATDTALAIDNYIYTLNRMKKEFGYETDILVVLQPTSPLRTVEDVDNSIKIFLERRADSVVSVCELEPIERARIMKPDGRIRNYKKGKIVLKNRADYQKVYGPNGAVFVLKPRLLFDHKTYYTDKTFAHIMSKKRSMDIDTQFDFDLAEYVMKK